MAVVDLRSGSIPAAPSATYLYARAGRYGIFAGRIKSRSVSAAYQDMKAKGATLLGELAKVLTDSLTFVQDPYGNLFMS